METGNGMRARPTLKTVLLAPLFALAGCVSLGAEPPDSLLTLTAETSAPAGSEQAGTRAEAILIHEPDVPAAIDVLRVPVQVTDSEIAYLKDAVWVEKPSRQFRRLLAETLRVKTNRLVIDGDDPALFAEAHLRGTLRRFGYDAASGGVVVQYDAIRQGQGGKVESRRFEASESGIAAEAGPVGDALNRAANTVAREVAEWIASGS